MRKWRLRTFSKTSYPFYFTTLPLVSLTSSPSPAPLSSVQHLRISVCSYLTSLSGLIWIKIGLVDQSEGERRALVLWWESSFGTGELLDAPEIIPYMFSSPFLCGSCRHTIYSFQNYPLSTYYEPGSIPGVRRHLWTKLKSLLWGLYSRRAW